MPRLNIYVLQHHMCILCQHDIYMRCCMCVRAHSIRTCMKSGFRAIKDLAGAVQAKEYAMARTCTTNASSAPRNLQLRLHEESTTCLQNMHIGPRVIALICSKRTSILPSLMSYQHHPEREPSRFCQWCPTCTTGHP